MDTHDEAPSISELSAHAWNIRRHVVAMAAGKGEGYVGQGLQAADILAVLFGAVLNWSLDRSDDSASDRFILSTGHYSIALWAAHAEFGLLDLDELRTYGADGSDIAMSTERGRQPHVELTGGSLGHGLGVAAGLAYGRRLRGDRGRVFNYMSDGELQEGSTWESAMFAADASLSNVINIVDVNRTQADGPLVLEVEPVAEKFRAFGWWAEDVNGNDVGQLVEKFAECAEVDRPKALVCQTQIGFGVPLIVDRERSHFVRVDPNEWAAVSAQLEEE